MGDRLGTAGVVGFSFYFFFFYCPPPTMDVVQFSFFLSLWINTDFFFLLFLSSRRVPTTIIDKFHFVYQSATVNKCWLFISFGHLQLVTTAFFFQTCYTVDYISNTVSFSCIVEQSVPLKSF